MIALSSISVEHGERILRTYKTWLAEKDNEIAEKDNEIAKKEARIAYLEAQLKRNQ